MGILAASRGIVCVLVSAEAGRFEGGVGALSDAQAYAIGNSNNRDNNARRITQELAALEKSGT
jgi:hypothetical protein